MVRGMLFKFWSGIQRCPKSGHFSAHKGPELKSHLKQGKARLTFPLKKHVFNDLVMLL